MYKSRSHNACTNSQERMIRYLQRSLYNEGIYKLTDKLPLYERDIHWDKSQAARMIDKYKQELETKTRLPSLPFENKKKPKSRQATPKQKAYLRYLRYKYETLKNGSYEVKKNSYNAISFNQAISTINKLKKGIQELEASVVKLPTRWASRKKNKGYHQRLEAQYLKNSGGGRWSGAIRRK